MIDWLSTSRDTGKSMEAAEYAWPHFEKWASELSGVRSIEKRPGALVVWEDTPKIPRWPDGDHVNGIGYTYERPNKYFMGVPVVFLRSPPMSDSVLK